MYAEHLPTIYWFTMLALKSSIRSQALRLTQIRLWSGLRWLQCRFGEKLPPSDVCLNSVNCRPDSTMIWTNLDTSGMNNLKHCQMHKMKPHVADEESQVMLSCSTWGRSRSKQELSRSNLISLLNTHAEPVLVHNKVVQAPCNLRVTPITG